MRRAGQGHDGGLTLPLSYLQHIGEQLRSMGAPVTRWLALSRMTEAQLRDPSLALSYAAFRQLVRDALAVAREPALGLLVGERLGATSHGIVGYAAANSGTLREALSVLERFTGLRTSLIAISQKKLPGEVRVRFAEAQPLGDIRRPLLEAVVLSIKNVLDAISMGACQVRGVAFPFAAPEYAALARELFRCPVRYGQSWTGIILPSDVMDVPLRLADPDAFEEAARICQRELDKLEAGGSLAARVRRILLSTQHGFPSLPATARLLHLTPRTLHRRLLEEGTSYRDLLEELRRTLAVEHLRSGHLSIEEIAYLLGYSDPANFRRAFKRWASAAPSAYRRDAGRGAPDD